MNNTENKNKKEKRKKHTLILISLIVLIIGGVLVGYNFSHKNKEDFRRQCWGASIDEVVQFEENMGSEIKKKNGYFDDNDIVILADNVNMNGFMVNVHYIFKNKKDTVLIHEINRKNLYEKYGDEIRLNDYILTEGMVFFKNTNKKDVNDIINILNQKYEITSNDIINGKVENGFLYVKFKNSRTRIVLQCSEKYDKLTMYYEATYKSLEPFILNKKQSIDF